MFCLNPWTLPLWPFHTRLALLGPSPVSVLCLAHQRFGNPISALAELPLRWIGTPLAPQVFAFSGLSQSAACPRHISFFALPSPFSLPASHSRLRLHQPPGESEVAPRGFATHRARRLSGAKFPRMLSHWGLDTTGFHHPSCRRIITRMALSHCWNAVVQQ